MGYKNILNEYLFNSKEEDRRNLSLFFNLETVEGARNYHMFNMFNRTQSMFKYSGLPDTITPRNLELIIQRSGYCGIAEVKSKNTKFKSGLYALFGTLGGSPDPYYMPTKFVYANAGLNASDELEIHNNCVVIPNDALYMGLLPMNSYNADFLTHAYITLKIALINSRMTNVFTAGDDDVYNSCLEYIKKIENGSLGIIHDTTFMSDEMGGVSVHNQSSVQTELTKIIEAIQFVKASWFNDLGLQANYNMKRESLSESEVALNQDVMLPLVDNMLEMRKIGIDEVNKMFGTNISVELNSSWKNTHMTAELSIKSMKKEVDDTSDQTENDNAEDGSDQIESEGDEDDKAED